MHSQNSDYHDYEGDQDDADESEASMGRRDNQDRNRRKRQSFFGQDFEVMPILNDLYDICRNLLSEKDPNTSLFNLPTLVIIGDQSQGKSSVVEGIMRMDALLPKGEKIQTRCPIEIQLTHVSPEQDEKFEVKVSDSSEFQQFDDIKNVREAIQARTDEIKELQAGITHERIVVKIYSPVVPDLTLVDTPGFVTVNTDDQNKDIVDAIYDVVHSLISNSNSIILAVTQASNNIATSRSIVEAAKVDPKRERTLGIITKLDLLDSWKPVENVLRNVEYHLKLGFVGVINRSPLDNEQGKSVEANFIHEAGILVKRFPDICAYHGTPYLTQRISDVLLEKVGVTLPTMKENVSKLISTYKARAVELGSAVRSEDRKMKLVTYVVKFLDSFKAEIDGTRRDIRDNSLVASAKIQEIFRGLLKNNELTLMEGVTDERIRHVVKNSHPLQTLMGLANEDAFHQFAKKEIVKFRPYVISCLEQVYEIIISAIRASCDAEAERYPQLNIRISLEAKDVVDECFKSCSDYIAMHLDALEALVYDSGPDFCDKLKTPPTRVSATNGEGSRDSENQGTEHGTTSDVDAEEVTQVRIMVGNYVEIVAKRLRDHCPQAITQHLVYAVLEKMSETMTNKIDEFAAQDDLLQEATAVIKERKEVNDGLQKLQDAKKIIERVETQLIKNKCK